MLAAPEGRQTTAVREPKQMGARARQCKICSSHLLAFFSRFAVETEPLRGLKYQGRFDVSN